MFHVQVAAKVVWNSRDNKFIGHIMTEEEMGSLVDVYRTLDPERRTKKTKYVMQTIWRDLSSKFDVLGPYFMSESGFDNKYVTTIVEETMLKLNWYGFCTVGVVCDGASPNLTMINVWTEGKKGAYRVNLDDAGDKHRVSPSFTDPFTGRKVHFVICPSHQVRTVHVCLHYCNQYELLFIAIQLKNMIAQLYQSRHKGIKAFKLGDSALGWDAIEGLFSREMDRINNGRRMRVPGLKPNYVFRDSWTRLNVRPAKIMQVCSEVNLM